MPSTYDRAAALTRRSAALALVPFVASLLSLSKVQQALAANGGGVTFPFPSGLPTLWTYVSLPGVAGSGAGTHTGPASLVAFVPLFLVGLLVNSALEAGFLGALDGRLDATGRGFAAGVEQFTFRIVGVNLIRTAIVLVALPFVVVTQDAGLGDALERTVDLATDGGAYARFGLGHLLAGAVASLGLSVLARNGGVPGIALGAALVPVPAVFVAAYGLLVFRDFGDDGASEHDVGPATDTGHDVEL